MLGLFIWCIFTSSLIQCVIAMDSTRLRINGIENDLNGSGILRDEARQKGKSKRTQQRLRREDKAKQQKRNETLHPIKNFI